MVLWDEVAYEIALEFPHVTLDKMLVDAMVSSSSQSSGNQADIA